MILLLLIFFRIFSQKKKNDLDTDFPKNTDFQNAHQSADQDFSFDSESSDDTLPDLENDVSQNFDDSTLEFKDSNARKSFFL